MMASATTQTAIEKASNAPHGPSRSEREIKGRQHYPTTVDGATVLVAENGATDPDLPTLSIIKPFVGRKPRAQSVSVRV
jgi:hypothetical protein